MRTLTCCTVFVAVAAALLLAGCASTPAPVVNHSFGPNGQPAGGQTPAASAPANNAGGAQTFGLGSHAHGTSNHGAYTVAAGDTLYSIAFAHGLDFRALAARNAIAPPYTIHPGQVLQLGAAAPATTAAPAPAAVAMTPAVAPPPAQQPAQPGAPVFGPVTPQTMTASGVAAAPAASSTVGPAPATAASVPPATAAPATPPPAAPIEPQLPGSAEPAPAAASVVSGPTRNAAGITWQWPAAGKPISGFQPDVSGDGAGINIAGKLGDPVRAAASGTVVYSGNGLPGYGDLVIIKHNDTYLSAYGHNSKRLVKEGEHVSAGQEIALMGASGAPRVELHFEVRKDGKPVDPMAYLPQR